MDYRDLLKKYIRHVGQSEGSTFLGADDTRHTTSDRLISPEEHAELIRLNDEVENEGWDPDPDQTESTN